MRPLGRSGTRECVVRKQCQAGLPVQMTEPGTTSCDSTRIAPCCIRWFLKACHPVVQRALEPRDGKSRTGSRLCSRSDAYEKNERSDAARDGV